jgi:hypothetical protein
MESQKKYAKKFLKFAIEWGQNSQVCRHVCTMHQTCLHTASDMSALTQNTDMSRLIWADMSVPCLYIRHVCSRSRRHVCHSAVHQTCLPLATYSKTSLHVIRVDTSTSTTPHNPPTTPQNPHPSFQTPPSPTCWSTRTDKLPDHSISKIQSKAPN